MVDYNTIAATEIASETSLLTFWIQKSPNKWMMTFSWLLHVNQAWPYQLYSQGFSTSSSYWSKTVAHLSCIQVGQLRAAHHMIYIYIIY